MNTIYRYLLRPRSHLSSLAAGVMVVLSPASALTLDQFRECVGPYGAQYGTVCTLNNLPAGQAYLISSGQNIVISRSNIQVKGTVLSSRRDTTLKRVAGYTGPLVMFTSYVHNVVLQDMTVDGNRDAFGPNPSGISYADVYIETGSYLTLFALDLINSPHIAIAIGPFSAHYITVHNCYVSRAYHIGAWVGGVAPSNGQPGYLNCSLYTVPDNVQITDSTFEDIGANAVLAEMTSSALKWNVFLRNHREASYNSPGGQIDLEVCTANVTVLGNHVQSGPAYTANNWWAAGFEVYGTDIVFQDNWVGDNGGEAYSMTGVQRITIISPDHTRVIHNNNQRATGFPGILVRNSPNFRTVATVTIDNNVIRNNHQSPVRLESTSGTPVSGVQITNSCFIYNIANTIDWGGFQSYNTESGNYVGSCPY